MGLLSWFCGFTRSDRIKLDHGLLILHTLEQRLETIMATQAELAARLDALRIQNEKARAENARLLAELRTAIENAGQTTPDVDAKLSALEASIQSEDDENPDEPPG